MGSGYIERPSQGLIADVPYADSATYLTLEHRRVVRTREKGLANISFVLRSLSVYQDSSSCG